MACVFWQAATKGPAYRTLGLEAPEEANCWREEKKEKKEKKWEDDKEREKIYHRRTLDIQHKF